MKAIRFVIFIAFNVCVVLSSGCAKDPSKSTTHAKVDEPVVVQKTQPSKNALATNKPLKLSGKIVAIGSKPSGSHPCLFKTWRGTATIPNGNIEKATVEFEVEMDSVVSDYEAPDKWSRKLDKHLKNDHFFDVPNHPLSTFVSTKIAKGPYEGVGTHTITGNLTLRGITKSVTFPADIKKTATGLDAKAKFSINRKEFGMVYDGKVDDVIRDGVVLIIELKT